VGIPFAGAPQTVAQEPQFAVSLCTFTHEPWQFVVPEGHDVVQAPPAHTWFEPHVTSHLPQ